MLETTTVTSEVAQEQIRKECRIVGEHLLMLPDPSLSEFRPLKEWIALLKGTKEEPITEDDELDLLCDLFLSQLKHIETNTFRRKRLTRNIREMRDFLIEKNRKYGNSAVCPQRIFSKAGPLEQIDVRIDDKLNRFVNQQSDEDEDVVMDLIGYLLLKRVARALLQKI